MNLVDLPDEIVELFLSFLFNKDVLCCHFREILNTHHKERIKTMMNLDLVSKKFSDRIKSMSNEFWWNLLDYEAKNCNELNRNWKNYLIETGELRRKVLLLRWARKQEILNQFYSDKQERNGIINPDRRVCLIGEGGVGKTSIVYQFVQHFFLDSCCYGGCIEDTFRKEFHINNRRLFMEIYDSAGQEEYRVLLEAVLKSYPTYIYIFCTSYKLDQSRQDYARTMIDLLVRFKDANCNDFPIVFAINKIDLSDSAYESPETIRLFIVKIIEEFKLKNTAIFETSAKVRINIDEIFHSIVAMEDMCQFPFNTAFEGIMKLDTEAMKDLCKTKKKKCILC